MACLRIAVEGSVGTQSKGPVHTGRFRVGIRAELNLHAGVGLDRVNRYRKILLGDICTECGEENSSNFSLTRPFQVGNIFNRRFERKRRKDGLKNGR